MGINFGNVIKNSRIRLGLSQCDLSEILDFSNRQMSRVENNKSGLSLGRLEILSDELNFNFVKLNNQTVRFKTYLDYVAFCELDKVLITLDTKEIKRVIENFNILESYNYGEMETLKFYALSVIHSDNDVSSSMKFALKGLGIKNFTIEKIQFILKDSLIEDSTIAIISVISKNLFNLNEMELAFELSKILFDYFNNITFSKERDFIDQSFFIKRQFIVAINNYAHMNFVFKNYKVAIELCDLALAKCLEYNILNYLFYIYKLKMENHYYLDEFYDAVECYFLVHAHCTTFNKRDYFYELADTVKNQYPEILKLKNSFYTDL